MTYENIDDADSWIDFGHSCRLCASRCAGKDQNQVVHIKISSRKIAITDQGTGKALAETPAKLAPQTWLPVRACFRGNDLIVQVADTALKASVPTLGDKKTVIALLVYGEGVGFRRISVTSAGKE